MCEEFNGFKNINRTMERDLRNTVQTQTEAEEMLLIESTDSGGNRDNNVGFTGESENSGANRDYNIGFTWECENSGGNRDNNVGYTPCEDTNSAESTLENEIVTRGLRKKDQRINGKEQSQNIRSIAVGVKTEDLLTVPGEINTKIGIYSEDTDVDNHKGDKTNGDMLGSVESGDKTNENMFDSRESGLTVTKPTSINRACEYRVETTKSTLFNAPVLINHGEETERKKGHYYVPTKNPCFKNQICRNETSGDMPTAAIRTKSLDFQNESDTYHFSYKNDNGSGTSHDRRQMKNTKNDSFRLDACNAVSSNRSKKTGVELHVASSATGNTGKTPQHITSHSKDQQNSELAVDVSGHINVDAKREAAMTPPESIAEENSGSQMQKSSPTGEQRQNKSKPQPKTKAVQVTPSSRLQEADHRQNRQHNQRERRQAGIPILAVKNQDSEASNIPSSYGQDSLSTREETRCESKTQPTTKAVQESRKQRIRTSCSQRVTSLSRHQGGEHRHDGQHDQRERRQAAIAGPNMRNQEEEAGIRPSTSTGSYAQNILSEKERKKSKTQPTTSAVQESCKQRDLPSCLQVTSLSRLQEDEHRHDGQHYQRERRQAAIPVPNVRNQEEADIRPSTSRGSYAQNKLSEKERTRRKSKTQPTTSAVQESCKQRDLPSCLQVTSLSRLQEDEHRHDGQHYQRERRQAAIPVPNVRNQEEADIRPSTSRGQNYVDDNNGDDGDGGGGQEANRRLLDCACLTVSVTSRTEGQQNSTVISTRLGRVIKRFFQERHFSFLFTGHITNEFVFHIGNKSINEVIEVLNESKDLLKQLLCREQIVNPNDLVIVFGLRVINGHLDNVPSTRMVV